MATYTVRTTNMYYTHNKVLHVWVDSFGNTHTCLADKHYKPKPLYKKF